MPVEQQKRNGGRIQALAALSLSTAAASAAGGYFQRPPAPFAAALPKPGAAGGGGPVLRNFVAGCIAACGAVTLTNPMDVARTRLELQARASCCPVPCALCWGGLASAGVSLGRRGVGLCAEHFSTNSTQSSQRLFRRSLMGHDKKTMPCVQGELVRKGAAGGGKLPYTNALQALATILQVIEWAV